MLTRNLLALALASALGLALPAQARDFGHRDGHQGFHRVAAHDGFRHGHRVSHHHFRHHHHRHAGHQGLR